MLDYNELKPGTYIVLDGKPYVVLEYNFLRMQQRKPAVQTKIKDLIGGKVIAKSFHPSDSIEEANVSRRKVKFLYTNKGEFWFCEAPKESPDGDPTGLKNNRQVRFKLSRDIIGEAADLMKQNLIVDALVFSAEGGSASGGNDTIINIDLPIKIDLEVVEAPPSFRGDTASGGSKQVKLETGATINAPFFINQGDVVRVNTRERNYVERVSKSE